MESKEYQIAILMLDNGRSPFQTWHNSLEFNYQVIVDTRLTRLLIGNFGNYKYLGDSIFELKISVGSGLRIYFGLETNTKVVIILGGNKKTQSKDIRQAKEIWRKYENKRL